MGVSGRRNISILTVAPTGTTSMMAQVSSGMECVFQVYYTRRTKVNPGDKNARIDFVDDSGDSWMENKVFHHEFIEWAKTFYSMGDGSSVKARIDILTDKQLDYLIKQSPWYGATSSDVNWEEKVRMQGAIQRWVDHSISVTVNLPNDATEELVDLIYRTGWESGCKGMTVYRDGCRSGVLITEETLAKQNGNTFEEHSAPKRPKKLDARVIRFQNNYDKWIAFVGLLDGKPYEVFTFKVTEDTNIPSDTVGHIIKTRVDGRGNYNFVWENGEVENIGSCVDSEFYNYGKLISSILRHGMPIPYIIDVVKSLQFTEDHISTWKNGVLRAIKQFIPDGSQATDSKCPECGDPDGLVFQEGCLVCKSCQHSKCG